MPPYTWSTEVKSPCDAILLVEGNIINMRYVMAVERWTPDDNENPKEGCCVSFVKGTIRLRDTTVEQFWDLLKGEDKNG